MKEQLVIYWLTNDRAVIDRIRSRFSIKGGITVNGETPVRIKAEDMPVLEETERRGFIQLRRKPLS
ncbi:MAG: hypothetical protein LUD17_05115 [Bacteroidales bacterium]|nr:hypothetical protein [Bacteroidales bacterium]